MPPPRDGMNDWVREGAHLPPATVEALKAAFARLSRGMPAYPDAAFSGRGVVMVGGGLHYLGPLWVSLHVLRRSGGSGEGFRRVVERRGLKESWGWFVRLRLC
jgi:hypothetical protein